jgi:hypothetical protein
MQLTERHENWLIVLVALHSMTIGAAFFLVPGLLIKFGGWARIDPLFFAHQAGAFHIALATAYLIEYFKYRGITVLVTAKSIALVFLLLEAIFGDVPWAVPMSGVADGAMALVVYWVHDNARRHSG